MSNKTACRLENVYYYENGTYSARMRRLRSTRTPLVTNELPNVLNALKQMLNVNKEGGKEWQNCFDYPSYGFIMTAEDVFPYPSYGFIMK